MRRRGSLSATAGECEPEGAIPWRPVERRLSFCNEWLAPVPGPVAKAGAQSPTDTIAPTKILHSAPLVQDDSYGDGAKRSAGGHVAPGRAGLPQRVGVLNESRPCCRACHPEQSEGSWQSSAWRNAHGASQFRAHDGISSTIEYRHDCTYQDHPVRGVNLHSASLVQDDSGREDDWGAKGLPSSSGSVLRTLSC